MLSDDGYICVLKNGRVELHELSGDNPLVKAYVKNVVEDKSLRSVGIPNSSMQEWVELCVDFGGRE